MLRLNNRTKTIKSKIRVGRGIGSGKGKTSGRGVKGQKSRSGVAIKSFEGGQMPLYRRLPKRGFNNINSKKYAVINLGILQKFIVNGKIDIKTTVTEKVMVDSGLVRRIWDGVRLLNKGEISSKVNLEVTGASRSAIASVEKNGGTVKVLKSATAD